MQKSEIPEENNIKLISMHDEMSSSYLSYAMSVIVSRALPDVRDGLSGHLVDAGELLIRFVREDDVPQVVLGEQAAPNVFAFGEMVWINCGHTSAISRHESGDRGTRIFQRCATLLWLRCSGLVGMQP